MKYIFLIPVLVIVFGLTPAFAEIELTDVWTDEQGIKHVKYDFSCRSGNGFIELNYYDKVHFKYSEFDNGNVKSFQRTFTVSEIINDIMPYYITLLGQPTDKC